MVKTNKTDEITIVSYIIPLCVQNVFSCHVLPCVCSTILVYVHTSSVDVGSVR
jgi:hypothetical protein